MEELSLSQALSGWIQLHFLIHMNYPGDADNLYLEPGDEPVSLHPLPPQEIVRENALHILLPVLLYLFCDPNHHSHFGGMRAALIANLLEMAREQVLTLLVERMEWFQMDKKASLPETAKCTRYSICPLNWTRPS
jgi:hypothetical protein